MFAFNPRVGKGGEVRKVQAHPIHITETARFKGIPLRKMSKNFLVSLGSGESPGRPFPYPYPIRSGADRDGEPPAGQF